MDSGTNRVTGNNRVYGLDVARCLAVSMVWIMHSFQEIFKVHFSYFWYVSLGGVELFFSLSGFLIGRILIENFSRKEQSITTVYSFWINRWLRTLPLYFLLYFSYLLLYNFFGFPVAFDFRYLLFWQNMTDKSNFFGETWSLSIEEWFYFTIPILIFTIQFFLKGYTPKERGVRAYLIAAIFLVVGMISFRWIFSSIVVEQAVIYRMDAIAYGLIAGYFSTRIKSLNNKEAAYLVVIGLVSWLISVLIRMVPAIPFNWKTLYFPICGMGTSLCILGFYYYSFKREFNFIKRLSKISYSVYLIHLSGFLYPLGQMGTGLPFWLLGIIWLLSFVIIFFVAGIANTYIEKPFLRMRDRLRISQKWR